jgi:hypothetical protein
MKNASSIDCQTATGRVKHCLNTGKLADSPDEINALDHVNSCAQSKECIEISVDYFEKLIRGRSLCGAFATPNVNYHK